MRVPCIMHELIAAIDLGSNSFRLQVGRIVDDQIYPLDGIKVPVRLAAGLSAERLLDQPAQERGLAALARFSERLRGFNPDAVRAVATNTLRAAKNARRFLVEAEKTLGVPIEIISGQEEARLIYVGVAHTLPKPECQKLIVDIGGGSTEFIIGRDFKPLHLSSLYMGSVSYSLRFFHDGTITAPALEEAVLAARRELQTISQVYRRTGWEGAVGSSGTAKALAELLEYNRWSDGDITAAGLEKMREAMLRAGHVDRLDRIGVPPDRMPALMGGFTIMAAVFQEFGLQQMTFSEGALRLGVLYDLLGRYHREDLRDATVKAFIKRYEVDRGHALAVSETARYLLLQLLPEADGEHEIEHRFLHWAAMLHEIGISIAHSSYHKHSAYIVSNADMPGFSKRDQARLERLVLAHRGKLSRVSALDEDSVDWMLLACLRLAWIFHRARDGRDVPPVAIEPTRRGFAITLREGWLAGQPLTAAALEDEQRYWLALGRGLAVHTAQPDVETLRSSA